MQKKKTETPNIGQELRNALTDEQIESILHSLFTSVRKQTLIEILSSLENDITTTVDRIAFKDDARTHAKTLKNAKIMSDHKRLELWNELWSEWVDISWQASEEDGSYIVQEYDWEEPYFDGTMLALDLENVAEKMLPLLDDVFELKKEEDDIFLQGCGDIEQNIQMLPEWMAADQDRFELEHKTSTCVLKWEWLVAKQVEDAPIEFVERIEAYEEEFHIIGLDGRAIVDFFSALPEKTKRRIYEYLTNNKHAGKWKERLDSVYSAWHMIYFGFSN